MAQRLLIAPRSRLVEVYDPFQSIYPWLCRIIGRLRPNLVSWSVIGFSTLWDLRFLVSLGVANLIFCHGINIIEKNQLPMKNSPKLVRKNSFELHRSHSRYAEFFEQLCNDLSIAPSSLRPANPNLQSSEFTEIPEQFSIKLRRTVSTVKDSIFTIIDEMSTWTSRQELRRNIQEQYRRDIAEICSIIGLLELADIFTQATAAVPILDRLRTVFDPAINSQFLVYYQFTIRLQAQIEQLLQPLLVLKEFHRKKLNWLDDPMNLIALIEKNIAKQTFESAVREYLQEETKRFGEDICRICEESVPIDDLNRHIKACLRQHEAMQGIKDNEKEILHLLAELKRLMVQSADSQSFSNVIQLFSKVIDGQKINLATLECSYLNDFRQFAAGSEGSQIEEISRLKEITERMLDTFLPSETKSSHSGSLHTLVPTITIHPPFETQTVRHRIKHLENNLISKLALEYVDDRSEKGASIRLGDSINSSSRNQHYLGVFQESQDSSSNNCSSESRQSSQDAIELSPTNRSCQEKRICFKDFKVIKALGQGAFGKVFLVQRKLTKDLYAMKVIELTSSSDKQTLHDLISEHDIFKKIGGDYLVKAAFSFSEGSAHFFLMEYMRGGDLSTLLEKEVYLEEELARRYLAEIVLAIEHLHSFGIIHRDLKPVKAPVIQSNLVFDDQGHIKLTDFGLSLDKKNSKEQGGKRIVGTPDYMAPQILTAGCTTNKSLDWWSLGVLVYQMLLGARPFGGTTVQEVYNNVLRGELEWPQIGYGSGMISPEAKDLIEKLLVVDSTQRLGQNGTADIKQHPFFRPVNWSATKHQQLSFKPSCEPMKYQQDRQLTYTIQRAMNGNVRLQMPEALVRFDILSQQTIRSMEKGKTRKSRRLCQIHNLTRKVDKHFA